MPLRTSCRAHRLRSLRSAFLSGLKALSVKPSFFPFFRARYVRPLSLDRQISHPLDQTPLDLALPHPLQVLNQFLVCTSEGLSKNGRLLPLSGEDSQEVISHRALNCWSLPLPPMKTATSGPLSISSRLGFSFPQWSVFPSRCVTVPRAKLFLDRPPAHGRQPLDSDNHARGKGDPPSRAVW